MYFPSILYVGSWVDKIGNLREIPNNQKQVKSNDDSSIIPILRQFIAFKMFQCTTSNCKYAVLQNSKVRN